MRRFSVSDKIIDRPKLVEVFLADVKKYKVLTKEEELKYLQLAKGGDQKAIDMLITTNLRFITSVAKEYVSTFHTISDLINVGAIGLIKSIARYDISSGNRFLSFGVWGIRGEIFEYINKETLIPLPYYKITKRFIVKKIVTEYFNIHGELPTHGYISKHSKNRVALKDVKGILDILEWGDESINDIDGEGVLDEITPSVTQAELDDDKEVVVKLVANLLGRLTDREQYIINRRFGLNGNNKLTLEEIGDKIKLTREGVRKIEIKAITKLKKLRTNESV